MKIIRNISLALAFLLPVAAFASTPDISCCDDGGRCPSCPICAMLHHK
jgi:hypothetical protein